MRGKILITIVAGIIVAALIALMWWWFLYRAPNTTPNTTGTFGASQNRPGGAATTTGPRTNIPSKSIYSSSGSSLGEYDVVRYDQGRYAINPIGSAGLLGAGTYTMTIDGVQGAYTVTPVGTDGGTTIYSVAPYTTPGFFPTSASSTDLGLGNASTTDVSWFTGGSSVFTPTAINSIAQSNPTGGVLPNISGGLGGTSGGLGLGGALLGAGLAGAASCGAMFAFQELFGLAGAAPAAGLVGGAGAGAGAGAVAAGVALQVPVYDSGSYVVLTSINSSMAGILGTIKAGQVADQKVKTFWDCIARTVAKATLQQITTSVVNWINNGFNGSPSFVTNPTQFFTNIADRAAGEYIQSTALAFLCSPFRLQIRIAIANSYARHNAPQCTLTRVIRNVNSFMNGNFAAGGWPGFLEFTSVPTNNPYGAYAAASIGLELSIQSTVASYRRQLSLSPFLDFKKKENCGYRTVAPAPNPDLYIKATANGFEVCDLKSTTPGTIISASLEKTLGSTIDQNVMAKSFDEIISALINQLITRAIQGLSELSGPGGYESNFYTPEQLQAQSAGRSLLTELQNATVVAQSYASVQQGSISDVQNIQARFSEVYACWQAKGQSNTSNSGENAALASTTVAQLESQVRAYNNEITRANTAIVMLQDLQSGALSAASAAELDSVSTQYRTGQSQGRFITTTELTTAQQNRTTLQSQLASFNQQAAISLQQCNDF